MIDSDYNISPYSIYSLCITVNYYCNNNSNNNNNNNNNKSEEHAIRLS